ncbi:MAG: AI-2E family transporter [Proteobacteria bacterium]|nr:AI-2E family transporter [Pseudomonadota bacterium]
MTHPAPTSPVPEWRFWLILAFVLAGLLWLLGDVVTPFFLATLIAYLLDPVVRKLNGWGVPRGLCAAIAILLFIALVTTLVLFIGPIVRTQATDLVRTLPAYIDTLQNDLWPRVSSFLQQIPAFSGVKLQAHLTQYTGDAVNLAGILLGRVVTGSGALLHVLMYFILTPVITFYLLRDWPIMVTHFETLLPARHAPAIRQELQTIDQMIAGFVRGQATVSLCLAAFYAATLYLTGLKYGMIIGLATGFLSFIPIVGTVTGAIVSLTLAAIQFHQASHIALVGAVFVAAQVLDGYFLTPNLVGTRVGLHPVWIIFAVIAGGTLFGFFGIIFAVPVAGTLAILLRVALREYRASRYYQPPVP